jgi:aspartate dehydrogenase
LLSKNQSESRFVFFEGSAREAAGLYPKNVNVGAAVALAGLGFEQTRIKLASEPAIPGPLGIIEAAGAFGTLRFEILALASPDNPKTSWITGHSLVSAALDGMCFPVGKRLSPNAA